MKYHINDGNDSKGDWSLNQERMLTEQLFNQKINFFLLFFALVIIGALVTRSSELFNTVLFIGAIICWILTLSIISTARRIGAIAKALKGEKEHPLNTITFGILGKVSRLLIGYVLPIACSLIITSGALMGTYGFFDFYFTVKREAVQKIDEVKKEINNLNLPVLKKKETDPKNFQVIDSVLN